MGSNPHFILPKILKFKTLYSIIENGIFLKEGERKNIIFFWWCPWD